MQNYIWIIFLASSLILLHAMIQDVGTVSSAHYLGYCVAFGLNLLALLTFLISAWEA